MANFSLGSVTNIWCKTAHTSPLLMRAHTWKRKKTKDKYVKKKTSAILHNQSALPKMNYYIASKT